MKCLEVCAFFLDLAVIAQSLTYGIRTAAVSGQRGGEQLDLFYVLLRLFAYFRNNKLAYYAY